MWAALGEANAIATQALTNIRTVRAFAAEELELARYRGATQDALQKALRDGVAEALAYTLVSSIDLGMSLVLLWYGGSVALAPDAPLTVGSLIAFNLYWSRLPSPNLAFASAHLRLF